MGGGVRGAPASLLIQDELALFDFGHVDVDDLPPRHPLRNRLESPIHFGEQLHGPIGGAEIVSAETGSLL